MKYSTDYIHVNSLSIKSIYLVLRSRGFKGLFYHLRNVYFDFVNQIDTSDRIIGYGKPELISTYATTPQMIIKDSLIKSFNLIGGDNKKINFVEMGAGKGKVIVIIKNIINKLRAKSINIKAIEIDSLICDIFKSNLRIAGYDSITDRKSYSEFYYHESKSNKDIYVELFCKDLKDYSPSLTKISEEKPLIIYCCNLIPVQELISFMRSFNSKKRAKKFSNILIYVNPVHIKKLISKTNSDTELFYFKKGFPQESYAIIKF